MQEVKIQTSNFSAEYGRSTGASFNLVTKNGTDAFHGGAFENFRNDALDARNFFSPNQHRTSLQRFRLGRRRSDQEGQDVLLRRRGVEAAAPAIRATRANRAEYLAELTGQFHRLRQDHSMSPERRRLSPTTSSRRP